MACELAADQPRRRRDATRQTCRAFAGPDGATAEEVGHWAQFACSAAAQNTPDRRTGSDKGAFAGPYYRHGVRSDFTKSTSGDAEDRVSEFACIDFAQTPRRRTHPGRHPRG